ncbi:MAG: hypothetical protein BGO21_14895 [Dyadobacter sp. 50-39]|uniref:hypothetical protein n=1 Tax=Dyadobacter sp. 50-39 TaxID=1895756 RepID=UPI000961F890|nr:hypothetical protein [Dyadobacter sp. 50-39]OJV18093.1 MAG: hypothetical protein BGO21_14895 [Dyadobacter sp. 50-39]
MKRHSHIFILLLSGLISCDKQPPMDPGMTNQLITGDINGVPFKSAITVEMGAYVKKDLCDKDVVALMLTKKNAEEEYQILYLDYLHARPEEYVLTDSSVRHKIESVCSLDSINASLYFQSYPRDDVRTDRYRLLEGPWNHFRMCLRIIFCL